MAKQHIEGSAEYKGVKSIPAPVGNGYPVKIDNKKTIFNFQYRENVFITLTNNLSYLSKAAFQVNM